MTPHTNHLQSALMVNLIGCPVSIASWVEFQNVLAVKGYFAAELMALPVDWRDCYLLAEELEACAPIVAPIIQSLRTHFFRKVDVR